MLRILKICSFIASIIYEPLLRILPLMRGSQLAGHSWEFSERFSRFNRDFREQKMGRLKGQAVPSSVATCKGYQEYLSAYLHSWVFRGLNLCRWIYAPFSFLEIWSEALDLFGLFPLDQGNGSDKRGVALFHTDATVEDFSIYKERRDFWSFTSFIKAF
jgi:hypothetical protein